MRLRHRELKDMTKMDRLFHRNFSYNIVIYISENVPRLIRLEAVFEMIISSEIITSGDSYEMHG